MSDWVRSAIQERRPALIFAQEVTDEFTQALADSGYTVVTDPSRHWRVRSAIAGAPGVDLEAVSEADFPTLTYHGSYVAAGAWRNSPVGPMNVVSVHASPNYADPVTYSWPGELPAPRSGGGDPRYVPERLWDSDLVLATLGLMAQSGRPLIAAGDFNESLVDDVDEQGQSRGTWGSEYFARATDLGLLNPQTARGDTEMPTRGGLQLDHFLFSESLAGAIKAPCDLSLDSAWSPAADLSDHVALWLRAQFHGGEAIKAVGIGADPSPSYA